MHELERLKDMAINPINLSRVSQNLRTGFLTNALQRNQLQLLSAQTRIASGRSFLSPSDDPVAASRVLDLTQAQARQAQFIANIRHGDNVLAAADSSATEINSLLIEAQTIASQNVSNLTSAAERLAGAELIAAIRQQLQLVGNRDFDGRYLFAGRETTERPFVDFFGGIAYLGDTGNLQVRISDDQKTVINVPGNLLLGALSSRIESSADLSPTLTDATRIEDLNGAGGQGILIGQLVFNEANGAGVFSVSLDTADTIGNIVSLINDAAAAAGSTLTASLGDNGLVIQPGAAAVTVTDVNSGVVAGGLGILTRTATTNTIDGADLGARLTSLTPVDALSGGNAIDLTSGLIITNGTAQATLDLSNAQTVQDITNELNNAGLGIRAQINEDGTGIDVINLVSGTSLTIGENGGTTATDLGIRTLNADTSLSSLNDGFGIEAVEGSDDLRVTAKDGSEFLVNLDGAATIGDVITLINDAANSAGVAVAADLIPTGNGIRLTDTTGGAGSLIVADEGLSLAAFQLGLQGSADPADNELIGGDVNPIRTQGVLTALLDLEAALRADDTRAIIKAAAKIEPQVKNVTQIQGVLGARSQAIRSKLTQVEDAGASAEILLSELRDLDYTRAVTEMQSTVIQLQAAMQTSGVLLNLSLMDFLR